MSLSFDVLLPIHDGEAYLEEAIESVFAQTHPSWRLLVIDDCSRDRSRQLAEQARSRAPDRVELLVLDQVHRAAGSRNRGAALGSGDALAFLDQDDRWLPEKLARQAAALAAHPEVAAVHTDVEIVDASGDLVPHAADRENEARRSVPWSDRAATASALLANNRIRLVSSVVRRSLFERLDGFDASLFGGEDWHFWVRVARSAGILHLPEVLLQRRVHGENVSRVYDYPRAVGRLQALRKLEAAFDLPAEEVASKRRRLLGKARDAARREGRPLRALGHSLGLAWAMRLGRA